MAMRRLPEALRISLDDQHTLLFTEGGRDSRAGLCAVVFLRREQETLGFARVLLALPESRADAIKGWAVLTGLPAETFERAFLATAAELELILRESETKAPEAKMAAEEPPPLPPAEELEARAEPILALPDPLVAVEEDLHLRLGGDIRPAVVAYVALTTRLLPLRKGTILGHIHLVGSPASGKNYAMGRALDLLPKQAVVHFEASSPRAFIYDPRTDYKHCVLYFDEMDSLPRGDDGSAANAIRHVAQEGFVAYRVTEKGPDGKQVARHIVKEGPTLLAVTGTRHLREQLGTRVLAVEVPEGEDQVAAALDKQDALELDGVPAVPEALISFQSYLQARAPIDVVVPFTRAITGGLKRRPLAPRANRDRAKLIAFIKGLAIIRHRSREMDAQGRLVATMDDYSTAYKLIRRDFTTTATEGASEGVRDLVRQVSLGPVPMTVATLIDRLKKSRATVKRWARTAVEQSWLVNEENRDRQPMKLKIGDPMPGEGDFMPAPSEVDPGQDGGLPPSGGNGRASEQVGASVHGINNVSGPEPSASSKTNEPAEPLHLKGSEGDWLGGSAKPPSGENGSLSATAFDPNLCPDCRRSSSTCVCSPPLVSLEELGAYGEPTA